MAEEPRASAGVAVVLNGLEVLEQDLCWVLQMAPAHGLTAQVAEDLAIALTHLQAARVLLRQAKPAR